MSGFQFVLDGTQTIRPDLLSFHKQRAGDRETESSEKSEIKGERESVNALFNAREEPAFYPFMKQPDPLSLLSSTSQCPSSQSLRKSKRTETTSGEAVRISHSRENRNAQSPDLT